MNEGTLVLRSCRDLIRFLHSSLKVSFTLGSVLFLHLALITRCESLVCLCHRVTDRFIAPLSTTRCRITASARVFSSARPLPPGDTQFAVLRPTLGNSESRQRHWNGGPWMRATSGTLDLDCLEVTPPPRSHVTRHVGQAHKQHVTGSHRANARISGQV